MVIRYRKYNILKDPDNYYRELLMLFLPWRDEKRELENKNFKEIYLQNKQVIDENYQQYHKVDINNILNMVEAVENINHEPIEDDDAEHNMDEHQVNPFDYDERERRPNMMVDIGQEVPIDKTKKFPIPGLLNTQELNELLISMNEKQYDVLIDIVNRFKTNERIPFYYFISGGAGVGKSRLIKAIFQSVTTYFRNQRGAELDLPYVMLTAPTGKAAHNIAGMTVHSVFSLPINQKRLPALSDDISSQLYGNLKNMKLLIIDEISMLGGRVFEHISSRLKQIFKNNNDFGGKSVLVFGDFNQLPPVGDSVIYLPVSKDNNIHYIFDVNPLWEIFQLFELTEIMRQREDHQFASALQRYAARELSSSDIAMFQKRCYSQNNDLPEEAKSAIHLFETNLEVDEYNAQRM